jgi:hypothetical protein
MDDTNSDDDNILDDTDTDHEDSGDLSAWEYYTQTYDNPQMFDDSEPVGIPRAATTQQAPIPEETAVSYSTLQQEQPPSKRSRSEIESQPLLYRGEQIPTHLVSVGEQQKASTTATSRNFSSDPELSSCSTRDYRCGQRSPPHHHYHHHQDPQLPFGHQPFPILPSSIESLVASAPPPPTQDDDHPPNSRHPTAIMMNHSTKSWSYPTMWVPHPFDPTTGTSTEATTATATATATAAAASTTTSTVPSLPPFMHSMLQQHSQPTWPWLSSSMVNNMLTSLVQQQPPTITASTPELATAYSHMRSHLVSMQQQHQLEHRDLSHTTGAVPFLPHNHSLPTTVNQENSTITTAVPMFPPPIFSASAPAVMPGQYRPPPHQYPQQQQHQHHHHHHHNLQQQHEVMRTTEARIVTGDVRVPRNDNDSYSLRSGVASPLDRSGALEMPPFTQEIVPPFQQHQNLRLLLRPLTPYNYFYRDERANILQGLTSTADDAPSDTTVGVEFPAAVADFSVTKMHALLFEHWYMDPMKPKRIHRKSHGKVNFETLSKAIAQRWHRLSVEGREFYQNVALLDSIYYHQHVRQQQQQQQEQEQGKAEETE